MSNFVPSETYQRISDISLDYLINDRKIKGLIFDFDGTLSIHRKVSIETLNFIKRSKESGLKVSVLSNNIHLSKALLKILSINTIKKFALKPLRNPFLKMAKRMKLPPNKIAVIGNNRISDVLGANRAGMYSIYIQDMNNYFYKRKIRSKLKHSGIKHVN